jgi:hypothetical protein
LRLRGAKGPLWAAQVQVLLIVDWTDRVIITNLKSEIGKSAIRN